MEMQTQANGANQIYCEAPKARARFYRKLIGGESCCGWRGCGLLRMAMQVAQAESLQDRELRSGGALRPMRLSEDRTLPEPSGACAVRARSSAGMSKDGQCCEPAELPHRLLSGVP